MRTIVVALLFMFVLVGCASRKYKDVSYLPPSIDHAPRLNVFVPRRAELKNLPVLIFVHGGNWNTGSKNTYGFLGRNFAKTGLVVIIPDYTLSPNANYDGMAGEIAAAIRWAKTNISNYGGNPARIFITGHSAGGHLAALAVMNPKYGIVPGTVSGIILNDAAGLDMNHYLEENPPADYNDYRATWTNDPAKWRDASPIYFLDANTPPLKIYVGRKTYASIKVANNRFLHALQPFQPQVVPIYLNKKHVPMVLQYFWPWSDRFNEVLAFIRSH